MPGEAPPEFVRYLRAIIDDVSAATNFRREAAAACAYFERRSQKAALDFDVRDLDEKRQIWTRILNACLRYHLGRANAWPTRRDVLFRDGDEFEMPSGEPEQVLTALLQPAGSNRHARRRQRAIDDPGELPVIASEAERFALIRPIARLVHTRLKEFGLAIDVAAR